MGPLDYVALGLWDGWTMGVCDYRTSGPWAHGHQHRVHKFKCAHRVAPYRLRVHDIAVVHALHCWSVSAVTVRLSLAGVCPSQAGNGACVVGPC